MSGDRAAGRDRPPPIRKSLGQHFLTDPRILERIADALGATSDDIVVEIGPGRGALTERLAPRARRLVAIEYDRALAAQLRARYADAPSVTIVEGDVLETDIAAIAGDEYLLIGNVPYYITTPILFRALETPRPRRAVYLVQREVAERIAAPPGAEMYGALSANVQAVAEVELLFRVPAGAFHPAPRVESAVIRVVPRASPVVAPHEEGEFRALVQRAFGFRRKQMRRVVRTLYDVDADAADALLARAGIGSDVRPEAVGPDAFAALLRAARQRSA